MKNGNHLIFRFILAFMVCIYSAMQTVPAFADDGVPPTSDPQTVVDLEPEEPSTPEEVISQLPEGTDVVVLSESGDSLPLVTQAAADGFVEGDPMWCPAGVAPKAGAGGCSPSFTRFGYDGDNTGDGSLIDWLVANDPKKAGTIWVAYDYDSSADTDPDIVIDGDAYTFLDAYALTVQGGWVHNTNGSKALFTADPYSYFTHSTFAITNWGGAITINNLIFDGIHTNAPNANPTALVLNTKGNITLNNITVRDSYNDDDAQNYYTMTGAVLDTQSGNGNIIINSSEFSGNEGTGLDVYANGTITTNGLIVNSNGEFGAYFNNMAVQGKSVTLKGFNQFNDNAFTGLTVLSAGAISISNLIANNNLNNGAFLANTVSTAGLGVTLTGTNFIMDNTLKGLHVVSHGVITASNLNASGNGESGAILDNCDDDSSGCRIASGRMVKLTGVNVFNGNDQNGLVIDSFGSISISNLMASNNDGNGAYLFNQWENFKNIDSVGTITITGYGIFQNNGYDGANINSFGNAVLTNIDASGNGLNGLYMDVSKNLGGSSITINGVNNFSNNNDDGIVLNAQGAITLSNVTAVGNTSGMGAYLANTFHPLKPYNVVLKGNNKFNENGEVGLYVESYGIIQINNLMANGNGEDGAVLDNCDSFGPVCYNVTPKAVTITGYAITSDNGEGGLAVNSFGAITLNNVTAEGNAGSGTTLQNYYNLAGQAVTLKGSNTFNENDATGLSIVTLGAITANNITAIGNAGEGAFLCNGGCGPSIFSRNVTLTGVNTFIGNGMDGLVLHTSGSAVLSRVTASDNDSDPADNDGIGISVNAEGNITLACVLTTNNNGAGYYLVAQGKIMLNGIYSYNPGASPDIAFGSSVITRPCTLP